MCEHLQVSDFRAYMIQTNGKKHVSTLEKCVSCGEFLTLDSEVIPKESIIAPATSAKGNMRTMRMQINSDLYDRVLDLIESERLGYESSKIMTELIGLGLHHYSRIHKGDLSRKKTGIPTS